MQIFIGYDPREILAFLVAVTSIKRRLSKDVPVYGLDLPTLRERGLYWRPTSTLGGELWDNISNHRMSTEFAISRFLTPLIAKTGWALFADCDVMAVADLCEIEAHLDPRYAVMCVKHHYTPSSHSKMRDQVQSRYPKKNWSSVVAYNCDHPANKALTREVVNSATGLWLHSFSWLKEEEVGALPANYNVLVGETRSIDPKLIHFTSGTPDIPRYAGCEYADWWRDELSYSGQHILRSLPALPVL